MGIPREQCSIVRPGDRKTIGPWRIRVLAAAHDVVAGSAPPFPGHVSSPARPPGKPSDWKLGEPLAFVIEANGQRIYLDSGGMIDAPPPPLGRIDLAILGVALPDSRKRLTVALRNLRPRYFLPSHQDDFFAPLDRGFAFGKLTNFPEVVRIHENEKLPGRLILLDYFRPWTIR
jgi:L-ascorbate metabolism protein UlaG (beta-lactamase superfamily)